MASQRSEARKWISLCAIIAAFALGFYFITPSSKPQGEFTYEGKTYRFDDKQSQSQQNVPLTPQQDKDLRYFREHCRLVIGSHFRPQYKCD